MIDPGLNHRLRQRSRRAGIMIGISMALTLALCVFSFTVIYAQLDNVVGDFVNRDPESPTATSEVAQAQSTQADSPDQPTAVPTDAPTTAPTKPAPEPTATKDPDAWDPDYQVSAEVDSVNLRAGPSVNSDQITSLPLDTPLQYLGESQPTENADADQFSGNWMKFRTEDGQEGWIRDIDVTEYQP